MSELTSSCGGDRQVIVGREKCPQFARCFYQKMGQFSVEFSRNVTVTNRKQLYCTESGRGHKYGVTKTLLERTAVLVPFVNSRPHFRLLFGVSVCKEKGEEF